jgi:hypothetical protein
MNRRLQTTDNGGEYLSFYYVGKISVNAVSFVIFMRTFTLRPIKVRHEGTGMLDEKNYTTHLLSVKEAVDRTGWIERLVVDRAWTLWRNTLAIEAVLEAEEGQQPSDRVRKVLQSSPTEMGVILKYSSPKFSGLHFV